MKIIDVLEKKVAENNNTKGLFTLAENIEKEARKHLKRVIAVLKEFDLHDESHSEKVIKNIEDLLGEEQIEKLSIYEPKKSS